MTTTTKTRIDFGESQITLGSLFSSMRCLHRSEAPTIFILLHKGPRRTLSAVSLPVGSRQYYPSVKGSFWDFRFLRISLIKPISQGAHE